VLRRYRRRYLLPGEIGLGGGGEEADDVDAELDRKPNATDNVRGSSRVEANIPPLRRRGRIMVEAKNRVGGKKASEGVMEQRMARKQTLGTHGGRMQLPVK
jgi:hypothetical protein